VKIYIYFLEKYNSLLAIFYEGVLREYVAHTQMMI